MKWFNIDLHISVITDLKDIFQDLGHSIDDWSLSLHARIMGKQKIILPLLSNWYNDLIKKELWKDFYTEYKDTLNQYDGFICCYPPAFSLLYKEFKKPIIIQIPIRYELPFYDNKEEWEYFNNYLREGVDNKLIFLVANSMYDKLYTEAFLNRVVTWIPSLCNYTGMTYTPTNNLWLYYSNKKIDESESNLVWKSDHLKNDYKWQDIGNYKGVVHFPYNCSTMSIFEQYQAGIPMLFPSLNFLIELYMKGFPVLNDLTWRGMHNLPEGSPIAFNALFDPNKYKNIESLKYWLQYADFYFSLKNIKYFDSFEELKTIIKNPVQKIENSTRKEQIYYSWNKILNNVRL